MDGTAIDEILFEQFTCPVCFNFLEEKIYICSNGHSICGSCHSKLSKCPLCKVKLDSKRNISLEKAAKKVKEWRAKQETVPVYSLSLKRKQRFSLGSPIIDTLDPLRTNQIQCPLDKCCYSTRHLLQLKIHLQSWHYDLLYAIKKDPEIKTENVMRIRLYWPLTSIHNMFMVTISEAFFIIYIDRSPDYLKKCSYYVNVLTVSNETKIYKFSCGTSTKFSNFYQGKFQAQDGIEVDKSVLETIYKDGHAKYFLKIIIAKVASLHGAD